METSLDWGQLSLTILLPLPFAYFVLVSDKLCSNCFCCCNFSKKMAAKLLVSAVVGLQSLIREFQILPIASQRKWRRAGSLAKMKNRPGWEISCRLHIAVGQNIKKKTFVFFLSFIRTMTISLYHIQIDKDEILYGDN